MILNLNKYCNFFANLLGLSDNEKIIRINAVPQQSLTSNSFYLSIQYYANNQIQNKTIFLKTSNSNTPNAYHDLCVNEIYFYKNVNMDMLIDVLPNCFFKEYYKKTGETILILEDLSKDFVSIPIFDITLEHLLSSCMTLAKFHSFFWNNINEYKKIFNYDKIINESDKMVDFFLNKNSHQISHSWFEEINNAHEIYKDLLIDEYYREEKNQNITLINGDAHISNFMFPKSEKTLPKLIDFQFWKIGIGCIDLAHLTRKTIKISGNKQIHQQIVKKYHDTLIEQGIKDYTFEHCFYDYKRCVATLILNPIWQYSKFNIPFDACIEPMNSLIKHFKILNE